MCRLCDSDNDTKSNTTQRCDKLIAVAITQFETTFTVEMKTKRLVSCMIISVIHTRALIIVGRHTIGTQALVPVWVNFR